jgi:hypothetical protein
MKQKKTFRLEEEITAKLEMISREENRSQADILEGLVRDYKNFGNSPVVTSGVDWQALYFEEKQRADEQSARLLSLSEKVADSLQASQVLQAMDKPALESTEQKTERAKKHWWKFWS